MRKQFLITAILVLAFLFLPYTAGAVSKGLPFGGFVRFTIPCTCSVGALLIFDKIFVGLPAPLPGGALLYIPGKSKPYANFNAGTPSTWNLGSYTPAPGIQASCLVGAPPSCLPALIPVAGLGVVSETGTSFPALGAFGF